MAFVSQEHTGRLPFYKNGTFRKTITLRGRIPGWGKRPLLFCALSFPPGVQSRKGAKMREEKLLNYLKGACTGRRYSASSAALEVAIGISGTDLRKLVNRMRRKGVPMRQLPVKSTPRFSSFKTWKMVLRQQDAD